MKLSISTWSFHWELRKKRLTLPDCLDLVAKMQVDAVEILDLHLPSTARRTLARLRKRCEEQGLVVSALAVSNDFGLPTDRQRGRSRDQILRFIDLCADLNAPGVRVFPGWPALGNPLLYEKERKRLWPEMIEHLQRCCIHAEAEGRKVYLENHDHGGFARTVDDLLKIAGEVKSSALEILLNTGDYLVDSQERNGFPALERLAYHAGMVHASIYEPDPEGRCKRQDYGRILDLLTAAGFQGYLIVEYEGQPDLDALRRSVSFLRQELDRRGLRGEEEA